ncbi:MAG: Fumarate reductase cytochrome b subunit [uncultured Campylobacterales bacterium]|uniref:Fumarate reductase cytochrome b subunit n=1 Tax=uncultured Campylobacterales bacterium TaxID=352960 RepID=A0A6S6SQ42_9BACT|nr:MAG: Fumarate reductase cytochrome b subunit [uncultured Campylobacterales bacterium]
MANDVKNSDLIELITKTTPQRKKSRWPAKLDDLQSLTGLILVIFLMFHLIFDSLIIFGNDAMYKITKLMELDFIIEGGSGVPVTIMGVTVLVIIAIHAALGIRKMPTSYRKYKAINTLSKTMNHLDSRLWILQVITGFVLFFTVTVHTYMMLSNPTDIGPYASADRFFSENMWIFYIVLLVAVVLHAFIGLYRVSIKRGWFGLSNTTNSKTRTFDKKVSVAKRNNLKKIRNYLIAFYLIIGLVSIAVYTYKGYEHRDNVGERYNPSSAHLKNI